MNLPFSTASDDWRRRSSDNSEAQYRRDAVRHDDRWPVLPVLHPITTPVAELHPDTRKLTALTQKRLSGRGLTGAEANDYTQLVERQEARARAADLAQDQATESRIYPQNPNIHDD